MVGRHSLRHLPGIVWNGEADALVYRSQNFPPASKTTTSLGRIALFSTKEVLMDLFFGILVQPW